MNTVNNKENKKKLLAISFIITLFYSLHFALPLYSASTFLSKFMDTKYIGLLYSASAILTLFLSLYFVRYIKKLHTYKTSLLVLSISFFSTLFLAFSKDTITTSILFAVNFCSNVILFSIINLFIEEFDDVSISGETRGVFLTIFNLGILVGALMSGQIINNYSFSTLWIISAILLLPIFFLINHYYKNVPDPKYKKINILASLKNIYKNKNIYYIMLAMFALECFYAVMGIYAPLYLSQNNNIDIVTYASVIMPIALIPFIILPYELGYLADKKYGEKEMLLIGLSILSVFSIAFTFINTNNLFYIAIFLLLSRVGAAFVESMCYTYFFKKVDVVDISIINIFGNIRTLAIIISPIIASIILYFNLSISYIFLTFGVFCFFILIKAVRIVDTR
jgi:MFS family permease